VYEWITWEANLVLSPVSFSNANLHVGVLHLKEYLGEKLKRLQYRIKRQHQRQKQKQKQRRQHISQQERWQRSNGIMKPNTKTKEKPIKH
jgi:hypothetical protein